MTDEQLPQITNYCSKTASKTDKFVSIAERGIGVRLVRTFFCTTVFDAIQRALIEHAKEHIGDPQ